VIPVEPPNPAIGFLEGIGFFTFLASLLVFIVLYYFFKLGLERCVSRLQSGEKRQAISAVLAIIITVLLFLWLAPYASSLATHVAAAVFILVFVIVVAAAAARIMGIDLFGLLKREKSS
jgi:small-conductance mechanosensitive channel